MIDIDEPIRHTKLNNTVSISLDLDLIGLSSAECWLAGGACV